jgi:hypothetical protein
MDKKHVIAAFKKKNAAVLKKMQVSYDRAEWHLRAVEELGLDSLSAYLPGGMVLAWAVDRELISSDLQKEMSAHLQQYRSGILSPAALYRAVGGILNKSHFCPDANSFLAFYYEKSYLCDYLDVVERGANDYDVADSQTNYSKVKILLDQKFDKFRTS